MIYELEDVDDLPEHYRRMVPTLGQRNGLKVGVLARLFVYVNGVDTICPWVTVREVRKGTHLPYRYVGEVAQKYPRRTYLPDAGDALFWHGMLVHGGAAVENPAATRKSMVIHYLPKGANRGHQVEGPFNW